jgi:parallel beta-helix repeat protein
MLSISPFGLLSDFGSVTSRPIDPSTPSPSLAAGPANLLETTTDQITLLDKGGTPYAAAGIDNPADPGPDFFSSVDHHATGYSVADTAAAYDPFAQRFVVLTTETSASQADLLMAVSKTSHPLDLTANSWSFYSADATHNFGSGAAYLTGMKFALDANYIYITGTYELFGSNNTAGVLVSRFGKTFGSRVDSAAPSGVAALTPVQNLDPTNNVPQVFLDADATTGIGVWSLNNIGQLITTPTVVAGTTFTSHTGGAQQLDSSLPLDTGGDRITSAVERGGSIYAANTVDVAGLATARWYQMSATTYTLTEAPGDVTDTPSGSTRTLETFLPAITVDSGGNLAITYTHSSANDFASFMVTGHLASDTSGDTHVGTVVHAGDGSFAPQLGTEPWGTSAGIAIDPSDGETFWAFGEFAAAQSAWGTWSASFSVIQNDRFHQNGHSNSSVATATNLGVAPGIHLTNLALSTPGDYEYYYFELLRQTSINIDLGFYRNQGDLQLEVDSDQASVDASGNRIDTLTQLLVSHTAFSSTPAAPQVVNGEVAQLSDLPAGRYYLKVSATNGKDTTNYNLSVDPLDATSRVFYVNDGSQANDYYALAPGDDANKGLSPYCPKASVQSVLANYTLGPDDTIVIDTGTYGGSTVTLDAQDDEGAVFAGSPAGSVFTDMNGWYQWYLNGSSANIIYGLTFQGNEYGIYASNSSGNDIRDNTFLNSLSTAIEMEGGSGNLIRGNSISNAYVGIYMYLSSGMPSTIGEQPDSSQQTPLDKNTLSGCSDGIDVDGSYGSPAPQASIIGNVLTSPSFDTYFAGIQIYNGAYTTSKNYVSGYGTDLYADNLSSPSSVSDNELAGTRVGAIPEGFGANIVASSGVSVFGNGIHDEEVGLEGSGVFGGSDWSDPNLIYNNTNGIAASDGNTVQFNRVYGNAIGISASSNVTIDHNVIYRNTSEGIFVNGATNVDIESNTIYGPQGNGVQIQSSSSNVTLQNNIVWAESGYDLYVATDSEQGFASDYNNLYTSGTGTIVHWQKDFQDLFDWQAESGYDTNSIGYTSLAPTLDNPQFMDLADDCYQLAVTSTSIAAGKPASDGSRVELGAYGGTDLAATLPSSYSYIRLDYPNFYTDWQVNTAHEIQWHDLNVTGNVTISLYDSSGTNLLVTIADVPVSDGSYAWTPALSGITGDATTRYVVRITSDTTSSIIGESREPFAIPAASDTYYVSPSTGSTDAYYTSAPGDNRHTGTTPQDPKANILGILHSYILGTGDTVLIDSGDYVEVSNVVLSGNSNLANGQGTAQGATFDGPDPNIPSPIGATFTASSPPTTNSAAIAAPTQGAPSTSSTGGSLESGTYYYVVTATDSAGETTASNEESIVVAGPTGEVTLNWNVVPGADGYRIYRGDSAGGESVLAGVVTGGSTTSFTDTTAMTATLDRQNSFAGSTDLELNQASHITLAYLTLMGAQQGLLVKNSSTNFTGENLTATGNSGNGIQIESGAEGTVLKNLTAYGNGGTGISVATDIASLSNSAAYNNGTDGIDLSYTSATVMQGDVAYGNKDTGIGLSYAGSSKVQSARVYDNGEGISVNNYSGTTLIGDTDLTQGNGNLIYDNKNAGISASGSGALVAGNSIYNNGTGLTLSGAQAEQNVIYGNGVGVASSGDDVISENLIYNNSGNGVNAYVGDTVSQNVIYGNAEGINASGTTYDPFFGTLTNNVVYGNTTGGIAIHDGSGATVRNNTVYQTAGDALDVDTNSQNIAVRDNIFEVSSGIALNIANDSQSGFASDYNFLTVMPGGTGDVSLWDGVYGPSLQAWYYTSYNDKHSLTGGPDSDKTNPVLFVNPANGDFHLQSVYGDNHGGTLAPIPNATTGLPVANPGMLVPADAATSPAIDAGDPADPFANEPAPNGNALNLGAYGNTPQASLSLTQYLTVTSPAGGEVFPINEQFTLTWRSEDFSSTSSPSTVNIDLLQNGSLVYSIAGGAPNTGTYDWLVGSNLPLGVTLTPGANYSIRITRADNGASDTSGLFTIVAPTHDFYVAVSPTPALTDATHDGLSVQTPKASIRAILETYDLETRDGITNTIHVAAGNYELTSDILVTARSMGVIIQGYNGIATQNRGLSHYPVFHLVGANGVTLDSLGMTGGSTGVQVQSGPGVTVINSVLSQNNTGASFDGASGGWSVEGDQFDGNSNTGLSASSQGSAIPLGLADGTTEPNVFSNNKSYGINASSAGTFITGNTVSGSSTGIYASGAGTYVTGNTVSGGSTGISASNGATVGGPNTSDGNQVQGANTGIAAGGSVTVENNTVFGNSGTGISGDSGGAISDNTVYNNRGDGISTYGGLGDTVQGNTVYHNGGVGIHTYSKDAVVGNDVYSNAVGIQGDEESSPFPIPYSGTVQNDLVYANSQTGIVINNGSGARLVNNTVYQQAGNAISVYTSQNTTVENNILSTQSSSTTTPNADLYVDSASEVRFVSDYNQFQWLGTAHLGIWQGVTFDHWADWAYQLGLDHHSLAQDQSPARLPQFVDPAGPDGILGYNVQQIIGDGQAGFSTTGAGWTTKTAGSSVAYDGSFADHAGSYSGDATASWTFSGLTPGEYQVFVNYVPGSFYDGSQWDSYYGTVPFTVLGDGGNTLTTTGVNEGSAPSDLPEAGVSWRQLPGLFTITGNTLTVQMSDAIGYYYYDYRVNAAAVLIEGVQVNGGADDDFYLQSSAPGIDAGDPRSDYSAEPTPNGGRINLGAYGGTPTATTSPTTELQVLSPSGLEKLAIGQTVNVDYRTAGEAAGATVKLEFSVDGGTTWQDTGLTGTVGSDGTGTIAWTIPLDSTLETAGNSALVRVTVTSDGTQGVSPNAFQIVDDNPDFYLSPSGDDTNSGKDADHPMKSLVALLAAYTPQSGDMTGDTIHFAAGTYTLLQNAVLTSHNSGVTFQGPSDGQALLDRGDNSSQLYVLDLVGAARVTIDSLAMKGGFVGVLADANSGNLTIENSEIFANGTGLSLAGDNATLTNDEIHDNGYLNQYYYGTSFTPGPGVIVSGNSDSLQSNQIYNNSTGITSSGTGALIENDNEVYNNSGTAIDVTGAGSIVSGNQVYDNMGYYAAITANDSSANIIQISSNYVFRNSGGGVSASGNVAVTSNQVHDNSGTGIAISESNAAATSNVVYANSLGISAAGGTVDGNRVFDNTGTGIYLLSSATAAMNQVYSNTIGIQGTYNSSYDYAFSGQITNDLIYANSSDGVEIDEGNGAKIVNDTIYSPAGNAVVVQQSSQGISLENNILWVEAGAAITVADDSQSGFQSDYNDLYTPGAAVGHWQGQDYPNLADWFYGVGVDQHSLSTDPEFIDPAGPDGILGFSNSPVGQPIVIDDSSTSGFSTTGSGWTTVTGVGYNNEVIDHVGSTTADATANWTFTGLTPGYYQVAVTYASGSPYYNEAPYSVLGDNGQPLGTVSVDQGSLPSGGWYALPGTFSITGNTLAVSLSDKIGNTSDHVNADAVRIQRIEGDGGLDDSMTGSGFHLQLGSPAIDAGYPKSDYSAEPQPNDGRINLGFDGNTSAAQLSPTEGVQVTSPSSFEKLQLGQMVTIEYHSFGAVSGTTYTIELSTDGGADYQTLFTAAPAVDGSTGNGRVSWTVPNDTTLLTTGTTALLRITPNDGNGVHGISTNPFLIANAGPDYYLSPTGDDGNSGKSADQPMYSLAALATAYQFQPGDVIYVAAGNYSLARDVILTSLDSGRPADLATGTAELPVTIEGPNGGTAVFDRGNRNGNVIDISGTTDIVLDNLTLQGGNLGINAANGALRLTVSHSVLTNDTGGGISVDATSNAPQILNNVIDGITGYYAVSVSAPDAVIAGNTIDNDDVGVYVSGARDLVGGSDPTSANTITGNSTGIQSVGYGLSDSDRIVIQRNVLNGNSSGIVTSDNSLVTSNQVQGGSTGISISGGEATQNSVSGSSTGISASGGVVDGNRVYDNSATGIVAYYRTNVSANYVYSNDVGIQGQYYVDDYYYDPFTGSIVNNLVYANAASGVQLNYAASGAQVVNNTIYTPVGDALDLDQNSTNVLLRNNIFSVDTGYDVAVDSTSGAGLNSDYNLFNTGLFSNGTAASAGYFGSSQATLADWQAASGQDTHSFAGNPQFVNPNGNDGLLGYADQGDHGSDDNFYLRYSFPAIGAGDNSFAPATDIEGQPRPATAKGMGGTVDIGAYEFRGNVADGNSTPPTVTGIVPAFVFTGSSSVQRFNQLVVSFSEDVNPIDASDPYEYSLVSTTDPNAVYALAPESYVPGSEQIKLDVQGITALPPGTYQFTVFSGSVDGATKAIHDLEGTPLAANSPDGFVTTFTVLPLISVTPLTSLVTSDAGGTAEFNVVLNQQPTADVTIPLSIVNYSDGVTRGMLSTNSLTFTLSDWNVAQTVTVTGVDDHIDEGTAAVTYSVDTGPAQSSDSAYNDLVAAPLTITAENNDVAGVTVTAAPNLTTSDAGGTAQFTVQLDTIPQGTVTIAATYYDPAYDPLKDPVHATVSPATLTFDASNWNTPQTVTVTGLDDLVDEGQNTPYYVQVAVLAAPATSDPLYAAQLVQEVPITAINTDQHGVKVTPLSGLVTNADGGTATFTVQLTSKPTSDVMIPLRSDDRTLGLASPTRLFFTPDDWNVPQTVTMTGVDDGDVDTQVDRTYTSELGYASSADPVYNGYLSQSLVSVTNHDVDILATAVPIAATEGQPFSGPVATFTDPIANDALSATISWNDGSTSVGTISGPDASGQYTVSAIHTFAEETTGAVASVVIGDASGITATVRSTVNVADAPLNATPVPVAATKNQTYSGPIATFTDEDPNGTSSDFTATIDWGDHSALSTVGSSQITEVSDTFTVPGTHAYAAGGTYTMTVTISDAGGATATVHPVATVLALDLVTSSADNGSSGTLRSVLASASNGDTIEFASGISLIDLTQGQLEVNKDVSIDGPGAVSLTIRQTTSGGARVFQVDSGTTVAMSGMTLTGGRSQFGGGILNAGADLSLDSLVISGNVAGDGAGIDNPAGAGSVTISNSSVTGNTDTNGLSQGLGIYNVGTLDVDNCRIYANYTSGSTYGADGAGIFNGGTATVTDSFISGNTGGEGVGGGITNAGPGGTKLTIIDSTLSGNISSGGAGGIDNFSATAIVINSTITGNTGLDTGGVDDYSSGSLTVSNSTIYGNDATESLSVDVGGGIENALDSTAVVANTIVAGNTTASGTDPDVAGTYSATDHNLIGVVGDAGGFTSAGVPVDGNIGGKSAAPVDPLLAPLGYYGIDLPTMALLPGSPAIDAGDNTPSAPFSSTPPTDERGFPRIVNGTIDIGAFESSGFTLAMGTGTNGDNQSANVGSAFANPLVVTVTANDVNEPVDGGQVTFDGPTTGASISPNPVAATVSGGSAQITVTANNVGGPYSVDASVAGATNSVPFALTNIAPLDIASLGTIATNPRNVSMASDDVTFSEPINLANFNYNALSLTLNGGANLINSGVTISLVSGTTDTYRIAGLDSLTTAEGTYTLSVDASQVQDLNGYYGSGTASVSWMMDTTPPTGSSVAALPARESSLTFTVTVNPGTDPVSGGVSSGIVSYDIYVASAPAGSPTLGPFTLWTTVPASNLSTTFTAQSNTTYAFHSVARDAAGNIEVKGANVIEASTYVPDLTPPVSQINSDSANANGTFTLAFSGTSPGGSGVSWFVLAVQVDNNPVLQIGSFPGGVPVAGVYSGQTKFQGLTDGQQHTYTFSIYGINGNGVAETAHTATPVTATFAVPVAPQVTSFVVEKGLFERSYIRYLDVSFNEPVSQLTLDTAHVTLEHYALDGVTPLGSVNLANRISLVDHVMEIDFGAGGIGGKENLSALLGNLAALEADDGYYALTIDPDGTGTHDAVLHFYRLFGDVTGNASGGATQTGAASDGDLVGQVSSADVAAVTAAIGEVANAQTPLLNADINGAGSVSASDRLMVARAVGRKLAANLSLDD